MLMEAVAESHQHFITSLTVDPGSGALYALCAASGEILFCDVSKRTFVEVAQTGTSPACFAFLNAIPAPFGRPPVPQWVMSWPIEEQLLYVSPRGPEANDDVPRDDGSDSSAAGVLVTATLTPLHACLHLKTPLVAPTAVAISPCDGEVFFTDAGLEGDASLHKRVGGVYRTTHGRTALKALQPNGLAQPSSLAVGRDGCVYVAEMCANQLLRFVPRDGGVRYAGAVFARFTGSMGPSAVVVHPRTGHVFVALYEAAEVGRAYSVHVANASASKAAPPLPGRIVELNLAGAEVRTYTVPDTQLRALALDPTATVLYAVCSDSTTDWSTLYRVYLA